MEPLYDGKHLPDPCYEKNSLLVLKVYTKGYSTSLYLPAPETKLQIMAKNFGVSSLDECASFSIEENVKGLKDRLPCGASVEELNRLAAELAQTLDGTEEQRKKLFAALEAEAPSNVDDAIRISRQLDQYEIVLLPEEFTAPSDYAHKEKQHYIPQFYLRYFSSEEGKLWVYDCLKERYFQSYPKDICREDWLYETFWEDANPQLGKFVLQNEIEKDFSGLEGEINTAFKRIIDVCEEPRNRNALICSSGDKKVLTKFVVNMLLRNPWSLEQAKVDSLPEEVVEDKEVQLIRQLFLDIGFGSANSLIKAANKKVWLDGKCTESVPEQLVGELHGLNFSILSSDKAIFITSSFPVIYDIYDSNDGITHLQMIYMPIHPHFAVLYTNNSIVKPYRNRIVALSDNEVNCMNQLYLRSDIGQLRFIISNKKSVLKLITNK